MNTVCLIIAAVCFGIGALAAFIAKASAINWMSAGLCFVTIAYILGHR
jgi:hypothetical protein